MKTGTLYLVKSKNPPVFQTPMTVHYKYDPELNEAFLFSSRVSNFCNLSTTVGLVSFPGFKLIITRNSCYVLTEAQEIDDANA